MSTGPVRHRATIAILGLGLHAIACESQAEDTGDTLEAFDAQCASITTQEACTPDAVSTDGLNRLCEWVRVEEFSSGCADPVERHECRGVEYAGAGCGSLSNVPGCETISEPTPSFREVEGATEILHSPMCANPPGFEYCDESVAAPPQCACAC